MSTKKSRAKNSYTFTLRNWLLIFLCVILMFALIWGGLLLARSISTTSYRVELVEGKCDEIAAKFGDPDFEEQVTKMSVEYGVQVIIFSYPDDRIDFDSILINTSPYTPSQSNVSIEVDDFYQDIVNTCILNMINTGKTKSCDVFQTNYYDASFIIYYNLLSFGEQNFFMYASVPLSMTEDALVILNQQLAIVSVVSFILVVLLSGIIAYVISKPIKQLSGEAARMSKGDYSVFFDGNGCDEVDILAESLNFSASQLKQTQTLRQDVIANVSHDLKTPLTLIKSYAELLKDFPDAPINKREDRLNLIISETDRMTRLVNEMLKLAKEESGIIPINKETFNLSELVTKVAEAFGVKETQGYVFEIQIQPNLFVSADKPQIEKVLNNYIQNAVNYTGRDLKVKIELKDINNKARFDVVDTGKGIAEDEREKIWDRYYRASKQYTRGSGTGLGLSIVKNILTRHGFIFGVNSVVGKGSDFYFEIPLIKTVENDEETD